MSTTPISSERATPTPGLGTIDEKLEVIVIPVADVDRAKRFYENLGWRVDADFLGKDGYRVVQLTPPGSQCSIQFGKGITAAAPGSVQGLMLIVDDVGTARAELLGRGVDVSDVFHLAGFIDVSTTNGRLPGPDPHGRSYFSWASFRDPDGNGWLLQEVKTRLPGRGGVGTDLETLIEVLKEAEMRHGAYEATAPKHHWSGWYGAYIIARQRGQGPDEAAKDATRHMDAILKQA